MLRAQVFPPYLAWWACHHVHPAVIEQVPLRGVAGHKHAGSVVAAVGAAWRTADVVADGIAVIQLHPRSVALLQL